jgi:hypothetical protein
MGEPERRRRRLRAPSSSSAAAPPPADPVIDPAGTAVDAGAAETGAAETAAAGTAAAGTAAAGTAAAETVGVEDPEVPEPASPRPMRRPPRPPSAQGGGSIGGDEVERGLRGLVGSGSSQVSVGAALRARDAARPTDEHLADAEENLTIVRRNWTPREDLPRRP